MMILRSWCGCWPKWSRVDRQIERKQKGVRKCE